MSLSNLIKATAIALSLLGLSAPVAQADDLTAQEQSVCASLQTCVDIIRRHDASEFDYAVLETEFRKFALAGKTALFTILESDDGQADIARMILALGPLTAQDRQLVQARWSQEKTQSFLPFLLDGHPMSRDLLLRSLGHPNADVREQVRVALTRLPQSSARAPLSKSVQEPLLLALMQDPIPQAAPYLGRLNASGIERQFIALLGSGQSEIVTAAYSALYRNNPAQAFNALLAEMQRMETSAQARAVGDMLAKRHKSRSDGFYLNFARDMSGDTKLSVSARASGLHAILTIADGPFPEVTPARAEAFSFLLKGQPFITQDHYLPYLKASGAESAMDLVWRTAQSEKWINRDRIAEYFVGFGPNEAVTTDLVQSNDIRSFSAGLRRTKPVHKRFVRTQVDHPVEAISKAARQTLGGKPRQTRSQKCPIEPFDLEDMRAQMPFFDSGWMIAENDARISLSRSHLTTAHPSSSGWLAAYDLRKPGARPIHSGGTLIHYDNTSGAFEAIEGFERPLAILPGRRLPLGQTTDQFWVVDRWSGNLSDISAYTLTLAKEEARITHVGALPQRAQTFSVTPNGDLLIVFEGSDQSPIRLSKSGEMSLACSPSGLSNVQRAPQ